MAKAKPAVTETVAETAPVVAEESSVETPVVETVTVEPPVVDEVVPVVVEPEAPVVPEAPAPEPEAPQAPVVVEGELVAGEPFNPDFPTRDQLLRLQGAVRGQ